MKSFGAGKRTIDEEMQGMDALLERVYVDTVTGIVTWTNPKGNKLSPGDIAGSKNNKGYHHIKFDGKYYKRHRLVFYVVNGWLPEILDHKNGKDAGDGIDNLQEASNSQNVKKGNIRSDNRTGYKGISWHKGVQKYQVNITKDGITHYLGCYADIEVAKRVYDKKAIELFDNFA